MPEQTRTARPLKLHEEFLPVTTEAWDAAVRQDLKGVDDGKRLLWRIEEGVTVKPYYRAEDLSRLERQTAAAPGEWPWVRGSGRPWDEAVETIPPGAIRADRAHDAGGSVAQEVGFAVAEGVDRLAAAVDAGRSIDDTARDLVFVFAVGSTYFVEIAKLRAARLCWACAVAAFPSDTRESARMRSIVRTARANKSVYDPYTNLLRVTTEAMSAAIGGADEVLVEASGFDPHLAVNVTRILAEESHLGVVADPAGGAYFIESLTDSIARAGWKVLQEVEARGGYARYAGSGALAAAIAASRTDKEREVSSRRRTLVGVNKYPDLSETAPSTPPPADADGPVPAWRMAAPIEAIRGRTERHAAATGHRPRILLLTRGDVRLRTARASFCLNFFGCGGFDVIQAEDEAREPADLIVLCSSDPEYLAFAQDVIPRAQVPVVVAGYPKDQVDALRAVGVAGFVHVRSDLVRTLTEWQQKLGINA